MSSVVGEQLRRARQERDVSLEQVAHGTHIRLHYLQAIEAGDFHRLPSPVQARGFLRAYASYLDLDPESLLDSINGESTSEPSPEQRPVESVEEPSRESSPTQSIEILQEIGNRLQQQRELLGLSLADVERHTHLRIRYLQSLESGRLEDLPSSVQGRGMLKNYAEFLGLNPEPVLLRFADALQARLSEKQSVGPKPAARPSPRRSPGALLRGFPGDFLLGGFLLLLLVGFVAWGALRISGLRSQADTSPTMPSIADELLTSAETTVTPTDAATPVGQTDVPAGTDVDATPPAAIDLEVRGTEEPDERSNQESNSETAPPGDLSKLVNVSLAVHQRAWVRVTVDDQIEFEGRMLPGSAYAFSGDEEVSILTGNGAGLQVFFNDQDLGIMGIYGEVVNRVFTAEGMVLPTPTITPTPTTTPAEVTTPTVTGMPQPTSQP